MHWVLFFVASYDSQGYDGVCVLTTKSQSQSYIVTDSRSITTQSQSYVTTDGQSASLSWCHAPIWGL
jgi:hypothetical protein